MLDIYSLIILLPLLGMALVKYGGGIIQASGSIAGTTHARNRYGNYIRARTKPVNPRSIRQTNVRGYIGLLAQRWHDTLTAGMRITWNTYANAVAMKNRLGETTYMTGFNHYLRTNTVRLQCENSKCDNGPTVLSLPEKDPTFAVSASAATQLLTITFDDTLPWTDIAASILGVWMGEPQLVTRNFFGGPWKYAGNIPGNQESPKTMAPPMTLVAGQKIWVYGRIATGPTDSRLSEPMYASCTVGA